MAAIVNRRKAPDRRHLSLVTNGNRAPERGSSSDVRRALDGSAPIGLVNWIKVAGWIAVLLVSLALWGAIVSVLASAMLWALVS